MSSRSIRAFNAFTGRKPAPSLTPSCFPRAIRPVDARCAEELRRFDATRELPPAWGDDESDAIESGAHEPCPIHCARPCCARSAP